MPEPTPLKQRPHWVFERLLPFALVACLGACASTNDQPTTNVDGLDVSEQKAHSPASVNAELGLNYIQNGSYKLAMGKLRKALRFDPELPSAYLYLGILYNQLEEYPDAEINYRKAITLDPGYSRGHNNFGTFLCEQRRFPEAEVQFLAALKDPFYENSGATLENLALCALAADQATKAEDYFKQALAENPLLPRSLFSLARMNYDRGDFKGAKLNLERYRRVAPQTPETLWLGIRVEQQLGNTSAEASLAMLLENVYPNAAETKLLKASRNTAGKAKK